MYCKKKKLYHQYEVLKCQHFLPFGWGTIVFVSDARMVSGTEAGTGEEVLVTSLDCLGAEGEMPNFFLFLLFLLLLPKIRLFLFTFLPDLESDNLFCDSCHKICII